LQGSKRSAGDDGLDRFNSFKYKALTRHFESWQAAARTCRADSRQMGSGVKNRREKKRVTLKHIQTYGRIFGEGLAFSFTRAVISEVQA
jgi:hypothetical protein